MPLYDDSKLLLLLDDAALAIPNMLVKGISDTLFSWNDALSKQSGYAFLAKKVVQFNKNNGVFGVIQDSQAVYLKHKIASFLQTVSVALRIITHPASQTISSGNAVTFTVVASGQIPLTYQWKKNGSNISGATSSSYTISSVSGGDAGSYTCTVSDVNGNSVTSNAGVLTVEALGVLIEFDFFSSDPTSSISGGTIGALTNSVTIASGADISMTIPQAKADGFWIVTKEPTSEPIKTKYYNTVLNRGDIPDSAYQSAVVSGDFRYYVTRNEFSVDYTQPLLLKVI